MLVQFEFYDEKIDVKTASQDSLKNVICNITIIHHLFLPLFQHMQIYEKGKLIEF